MILKQLWLHFVRAYIRLGLFFYYKKIKVVNVENVPKKGAVLFLANHQNALLDALLIATRSGRFSYFLTRASVFQNALISSILKSLLMLPVYRIRDGWQNLSKNNAIFETSAKLLGKEHAMVIFPEGSHHLNRTVRPLSKGFTRIIFETFERYPELKLQMIPVGLNFIHAESFADSVSIHFGNPLKISSKDIINKTKSTTTLKDMVYNNLCQLTTHIEAENYEFTLKKLKELKADFLNPVAVNNCIANEFNNCEFNPSQRFSMIKKILKSGLILLVFVPYLIWKFGFQPKIKEIEFTSTFRFAVAITLVPFYVLILTWILFLIVGITLALWYFIAVLVLALSAVKL